MSRRVVLSRAVAVAVVARHDARAEMTRLNCVGPCCACVAPHVTSDVARVTSACVTGFSSVVLWKWS